MKKIHFFCLLFALLTALFSSCIHYVPAPEGETSPSDSTAETTDREPPTTDAESSTEETAETTDPAEESSSLPSETAAHDDGYTAYH